MEHRIRAPLSQAESAPWPSRGMRHQGQRLTMPTVWFGKWTPLPVGIPRGPYARPTRAILGRVEAGLRGLT